MNQIKATPQNVLISKKENTALLILISQFTSPFVLILLVTAVITLLLQEYLDSIVITAAILINAGLGFYQEYKAENALSELKSFLKPTAYIIKDGKIEKIDAALLQIGDTVLLTEEFNIPADGVLIEGKDILVNEAILTGEAINVAKKEGDNVFMGTILTSGIGKMKVNFIGMDTMIGKIGNELATVREAKTPLQEQMATLAKNLSYIVVVMSGILFILGIVLGYSIREMFFTTIAVAVASVPEGLIISLTVILTVGMRKILKRKALVRKLVAAETLGSVSVICTDKTGTITEGNLKVSEYEFVNEDYAFLAIVSLENIIDPLELVLVNWAKESIGNVKSHLNNMSDEFKIIDSLTFTSHRKFSARLVSYKGKKLLLVIGAPELILKKSVLSESDHNKVDNNINRITSEGGRVIGLGYKVVDVDTIDENLISELNWNGIISFEDPIREGIVETFEKCQKAGIQVKMITGDHLQTAISIATKIKLLPKKSQHEISGLYITGDELDKLSMPELKGKIKNIVLFARTSPAQKLKIVKALKALGEVVAMTGDGVNDAPALKRADIGIVVNEASDVSKNTSDIVLLDSNFKTIVHAIEEGRGIFKNIQKVVMYLLSDSLSEIILIGGSILLRLPLPLTAIQILWVNIIEDAFPALSLAFEPKEQDVMLEKPRKRKSGIIDSKMRIIMFIFILLTDITLLIIYAVLNKRIDDFSLVRSIIFAGLGFDSLLFIFSCKSLDKSIFSYNLFTNKLLLGSVTFGIFMFLIALYVPVFNTLLDTKPVPLKYWGIIIGIGIFNLVTIEGLKAIIVRKNK